MCPLPDHALGPRESLSKRPHAYFQSFSRACGYTRGHPSAGGREAPRGPRGGGGSLVWTHRPGVERELVLHRLGALVGTVVPGLTNVKASLRVQIL